MFEKLVPMDEFFETLYASLIIDTLKGAGFKEIDTSIVTVAANEVMRLNNFCNTELVPKKLYYLLYEMILGSFLEKMYSQGKLPDSFDFEKIAGKIQVGDTSVDLTGSSGLKDMSEEKLMMWIASFKDSWKEEAITCRKIKW